MNAMPKMLRSGLAMLLAVCLLIGSPIAAVAAGTDACGEAAAQETVEAAIYYCDQAEAVVDVVAEYALGAYKDVIAMAASNPETYRSVAVTVIKDALAERKDTVSKVGFDPESDEDMTLLANEVYDVAIAYYKDTEAHGEAIAEENATKEVIRFALVEVDGYAEADAVEVAEIYYELNQMVISKGKDATVVHVMSQQTHSYKDGFCTGCGKEDPDYVEVHVHNYTTTVVPPTCLEGGYTFYACDCGDNFKSDVVPSLGGHHYTTQSYAATCTEDGYTVYDCINCDYTYNTIDAEATGHSYTTETVAASCTTKGYTTYTCACGNSYTEEIPALGHDYDTVVVKATCTEDGYTTYTCDTCGDTYTDDVIKATGHKYTADVVEATCLRDGYTVYTCSCGDTYTADEVIATGHHYVGGVCESCGVAETHEHSYVKVETVAPTCTADGYSSYTCACGDTFTVTDGKATGHTYTAETVAPTCTKDGYTTYTCECGDTYTETDAAATGHNYTKEVFAPTCTNQGYTVYTCACGHSYADDEVAAAGHKYKSEVVDPTCTENGYTVHTCEVCGDSYKDNEVAAIGHNFVNGTCEKCGLKDEHTHDYVKSETVAPTCTEEGYTAYTCECGDSYRDDHVAVTDHNYVDGVCSMCNAKDPDYGIPTEPEEPEDEPQEKPEEDDSNEPAFSLSDLWNKLFNWGNDDDSSDSSVSSVFDNIMGTVRNWIKDWLSWLENSGF